VISLLRLTDLHWPSGVRGTLSFLSLSMLNLGITRAQCWISFQTSFYVQMYFPFGVLLVLALYYGLLLLVQWCRQRTVRLESVFNPTSEQIELSATGDDTVMGPTPDCAARLFPDLDSNLFTEKYRRRFLALLVRTLLSFLSFSYILLACEPLVIFDCIEISGTSRLRDFVGIQCHSPLWNRYLITAIVGIILYTVGIPMVMMCMLHAWRYGDRHGAHEILGAQVMAYRKGYRWWDIASLLWKLAVVLTLRLLIDQSKTQIALFVTLLTTRILAQRVFQPFEFPPNNAEERVLMIWTFGIMLCGIIFYAAGGEKSMPVGAVGFLYVVSLGCVVLLLVSIGYYVYQVYRQGQAVDKAAAMEDVDRAHRHYRRVDDAEDEGHGGNASHATDPSAFFDSATVKAASKAVGKDRTAMELARMPLLAGPMVDYVPNDGK